MIFSSPLMSASFTCSAPGGGGGAAGAGGSGSKLKYAIAAKPAGMAKCHGRTHDTRASPGAAFASTSVAWVITTARAGSSAFESRRCRSTAVEMLSFPPKRPSRYNATSPSFHRLRRATSAPIAAPKAPPAAVQGRKAPCRVCHAAALAAVPRTRPRAAPVSIRSRARRRRTRPEKRRKMSRNEPSTDDELGLAIVVFFVLAARRGRYRVALGSTCRLLLTKQRIESSMPVVGSRRVFGICAGERWKHLAEFPTLRMPRPITA